MSKKIIIVSFIFCLLLCGCGNKVDTSEYIKIYYPNKSNTDIVGYMDSRFPIGTYDFNMAVKAIRSSAPNDSLNPILIDNTGVLSIKNNSGIVDVNFDSKYNSLIIPKRIIMKACIVNALVKVKGVDGVRFFIDGNEEKINYRTQIYTSSSFMIAKDDNKNEIQRSDVILYYYDVNKDKLVKNINTVTYNNRSNLEINSIRELINNRVVKNYKQVISPLPADTVVYETNMNDGVCRVKLNGALSRIKDERKLKLAVYSIVNSLSSIPGINKVQIYSNGEQGINFEKNQLYVNPLEKNENEDLVVVPKNNR